MGSNAYVKCCHILQVRAKDGEAEAAAVDGEAEEVLDTRATLATAMMGKIYI